MIAPEAGLSVNRQCSLLGIARSSFYYRPRPESAEELEVLKQLDRIFTRSSSLWQPPASGGAVATGDFGWPPARPGADEEARAMGGQAEAEHPQAASRAQVLSIPSARQDD
jgi:putative transposase